MNEVVTDEDQGSCCSFLKSTVKITFDIYNEEQEYIQAAEGEGGWPLLSTRYIWHC